MIDGDFSEKARTVAKPLLSVDQIRMLPKDGLILISGRQKPIKIKMPPYYESPALSALTCKSPVDIAVDYGDEKVEYLKFDAGRAE